MVNYDKGLVAIIDLHSRRVMSWQLSNTMDASFCKETTAALNQVTGLWFKLAQTELAEKTNLRFDMQEIKEGRKVARLKF
ncbi:MAG: hypothetical protein EOM59_20225, partial [Clostridia bacterium]|nr:hypothetical protein [Clostridia bacterium]